MIILGTRPEVLKLFPIIEEFKKKKIKTCIVFTGQHNELARDMINTFKIKLTYALNVMVTNQPLGTLSENLHRALVPLVIASLRVGE